MDALRIEVNADVSKIQLPRLDPRGSIRARLGSPSAVDEAVYHRRAVLHIHGSGRQIGLTDNLAAWALASAWRRMPLYPLCGLVILTGRTGDGMLSSLDDDLARQAQAVALRGRETLREWQTRRPVSNQAAIDELLAFAVRDVASQQ